MKGALTPVELAVAKDTLVKERGSLSDEEEEAEAVANGGECKDEDYLGRYKGHPIVWILDNVYAGGGGKLAMKVPAGAKTKKNDVSFPVFWMRRSLCILQKTRVRRHLTIILLLQRRWPPYSCIRMGHQLVE